MKYETTRFGTVDVLPENIINFPQGLPGFGELREFFFVQVLENSYFAWLQSVSWPEVAFLVTDPFIYRTDYEVHLPQLEQELLQITDPEEVSIHVIVRIPPTGKTEDITANFLAPLVVNDRARLGCQLVLEGVGYSVCEPLFESRDGAERREEGR